MKLRPVILICGILILGFTGCAGQSKGTTPAEFTLSDLTGNSVSLSQLAGKPVVINFWRLDCPACIEEMPYIQQSYVNNPAVNIITIAIWDSQNTLTQFMTVNNYTFPVLQDKFGTVAADYNIRFTPTTYFINSAGQIADIKIGPFDNLNELEKSLDKLE